MVKTYPGLLLPPHSTRKIGRVSTCARLGRFYIKALQFSQNHNKTQLILTVQYSDSFIFHINPQTNVYFDEKKRKIDSPAIFTENTREPFFIWPLPHSGTLTPSSPPGSPLLPAAASLPLLPGSPPLRSSSSAGAAPPTLDTPSSAAAQGLLRRTAGPRATGPRARPFLHSAASAVRSAAPPPPRWRGQAHGRAAHEQAWPRGCRRACEVAGAAPTLRRRARSAGSRSARSCSPPGHGPAPAAAAVRTHSTDMARLAALRERTDSSNRRRSSPFATRRRCGPAAGTRSGRGLPTPPCNPALNHSPAPRGKGHAPLRTVGERAAA